MAMWLVVFGVLVSYHEATVAHARSPSGVVLHAQVSNCHTTVEPTHVHAVPEHPDGLDGCELLAVGHASLTAGAPLATVVFAPRIAIAPIWPARSADRRSTLLRDAPKTSPPV